jgi:hypothetical protein
MNLDIFDRGVNNDDEALYRDPVLTENAAGKGLSYVGSNDFITVLTSAEDKLLTKHHTPAGLVEYGDAKWFTSTAVPANSLDDLADALECRPDSCVILGRMIGGLDPSKPHRRLYHTGKDGTAPSYEPAPHRYAIIDLDEKEAPLEWLDDVDGTVRRVVGDWLPPELREVDVAWRLTGSAGIKPGIRLRLAFMLDRALSPDELKVWLGDCPHVDTAIFNPVQPIYGSPIFEGVIDPIAARLLWRSGILRGERRSASPPEGLQARAKEFAASLTGWQTGPSMSLPELADVIAKLPAPDEYTRIRDIAAAVAAANCPEDPNMSERCEMFCDWAMTGSVSDNDGQDFRRVFYSLAKPGGVGVATLFYHAGYGIIPELDGFGDRLPSDVFGHLLSLSDVIAEYGVAPAHQSRFGFGGRKPSEGKNRPELTYFDKNKTLPKVPGEGCVGFMIGSRGNHKTGVLIKYGLDACDAGYRVLFIAAEDAHGIEKIRLPAAIEARGRGEGHYDGLWITENASLVLRSPEHRSDLIATYRDFAPHLVFIDVLAKTIAGSDVNASKDAGDIVGAMEQIAKGFGGATVLATRHPPLATDGRGTGSNEFVSLAYFQWLISAAGGIVTVYADKIKNGPRDFDTRFKIDSAPGGVPVITEASVSDLAEARRRTVQAVGPDEIVADAIAVLVPGQAPIGMQEVTKRLSDQFERYSLLPAGHIGKRVRNAVWGGDKVKRIGDPSGPLAAYVTLRGAGSNNASYEFQLIK